MIFRGKAAAASLKRLIGALALSDVLHLPRQSRRGLIEARYKLHCLSFGREIFRGKAAAASLKPFHPSFSSTASRTYLPRQSRRGLIEARPSHARRTTDDPIFRGKAAAASLKQAVRGGRPSRGRDLPRQSRRGLIEARGASGISGTTRTSSAAKPPRPH